MTPVALRRPVRRLLQVLLAAGLLTLLWHVADGAAAARHLSGADPRWLAAAFAALTLQTVLSALRWQLTAERLGIRFGTRTALREYYLSQVVNQALPGGVLGDASRALRARAQAGLLVSGQAVVFERLAGQVALLAVLVTTFCVTRTLPGGTDWPAWPGVPLWLAAAAMAAIAVAIWRGVTGKLWRTRLARDLVHVFAAPSVRWRQAGLSLGTALCNVAAFAWCTAAIGAALPVATALVLVPLILFAMVIPVTVSGWGLREGAAAVILPLAGATAAEGLAASVAFGLVLLAASLPGLAVLGAPSVPDRMQS